MWFTSKALLFVVAALCTVLGFIGLAIPLMPGFVFFAIAVLCLSSASPTLHKRLSSYPKVGQFLDSVEAQRHLPMRQRIHQGFFQAARLLTGKGRG